MKKWLIVMAGALAHNAILSDVEIWRRDLSFVVVAGVAISYAMLSGLASPKPEDR